jgi:hypothetical protein
MTDENAASALGEVAFPDSLDEVSSLDGYLSVFGRVIGQKAIDSLDPLHVPGRDPLPDFRHVPDWRQPFDPQAHLVAAAAKMFDEQKAGMIVGECGTGKTNTAILSIHEHAMKSKRKGGCGGNYRVVVICPDHIIAKWARDEIAETLPEARVFTFKKWYDLLPLIDKGHVPVPGKPHHNRWAAPEGAEWYVVGRDQIKRAPGSVGAGGTRRGFDGRLISGQPGRWFPGPLEEAKDADGKPIVDEWGRVKMVKTQFRAPICPKCGQRPHDRRGFPMSFESLAKAGVRCTGRYLQEIPSDRRQATDMGLDRISPVPSRLAEARVGREVSLGGRKYVVRQCGEPLWQWTWKMKRWPMATLIQRRLRRFFHYVVIDELHEHKGSDSDQGVASNKVLSASGKVLMLTGTLIAGYADNLFPLLMRVAGDDMRRLGFEWGDESRFTEVYGCRDRIVTATGPADMATVRDHKSTGIGRRAMENTKQTFGRRPGIMPTLFAHTLLPRSMFITLEELASELPPLTEVFEEGACDLPPEVAAEYRRIEQVCKSTIRHLGMAGAGKFMGTMLQMLLAYPDHPYGWEPLWPDAFAVGYWKLPKIRTRENFIGVVSPRNFDLSSLVLPKEQRLLDICKAEVEQGNQVWVYVQMTKKRSVFPRLKQLLTEAGLRVGVMESEEVEVRDRLDWIAREGLKFDVILSHPKLVATGVDLFSKSIGGHNYNVLVWYQTGYDLFTMRQASRRAWRIGQPKECRNYYLFARNTMQHRAMELMGRKLAASVQLEGEFSEDGLAAMAKDTGIQLALVKSLSSQIDDAQLMRSWTKVKSVGGANYKPRVKRPMDEVPRPAYGTGVPVPPEPSEFDDLPLDAALLAETLVADRTDGEDVDLDDWIAAQIRAAKQPRGKDVFKPRGPILETKPQPKPSRRSDVRRLIDDLLTGDGEEDDGWDW